jgi:hypothetical protein
MEIRSLTANEVRPRGRPSGSVGKIREVHHLVARLYALGYKPTEIAPIVNRTSATIRNWLGSPANAELVAQYCKEEHNEVVTNAEYRRALIERRQLLMEEELCERLEADPSQFTAKELIAGSGDAADRIGFGKQSVQVNISLDLKARMEQAKKRLEGLEAARAEGKVVEFARR